VPRRGVSPAQRARLLSAAEQLICDGGVERVTVADVCAAARVSSHTFHAAFDDRGQCLLAVFDDASDRIAVAMAGAYLAGGSWVEGVRGALSVLLAFLDDRPGLARFLIVGSLTGGAALRARRGEALAALARALEADCPPAGAALPPPFGGEAVVCAAASVLHGRLRQHTVPSLRDMNGALMGMIVLPYMDAAAARRELSPPVRLSAAQLARREGRGPLYPPRCARRR
jgi:AcrR family transcriptional regulator